MPYQGNLDFMETRAVTTWEALSSHTTGLIVAAVFALISALALAFICGRTIRLGVKLLLQRDDEDTSKIPEMLFFCTQLGQYAASLVLSNVVITLSELIAFKWISSGGVSAGSACQAQAILMQIGMWANCYFTVAHGVHTWNSLVLRLRQSRWLSAVVTVIGWTIALVAGLAPLHDSNLYGPTGVSCGVGSGNDRRATFTLQALPVILAAAASTIVYCVIFFVPGGKLGLSGTDKLRKLNLKSQRGLDEFEEYRRFIATIIRTMFWFPFAFVILLLPTCIAHIMMYAGSPVPYGFDVFSHVTCSLLGLVNVGLLVNTYRVVSPVLNGPKQEPITVKTFGNDASGESPISQRPPTMISSKEPVTIPSYKRGSFVRKSGHLANHSRSDSSSSADSSTELLKHQKSRKYSRAKMAYPRHIVSPAELSRQISDGTPMSQKRGSGLKSTVTVSLSPPPPSPHRVLSGGQQLESEHLVKEKMHLVRQSTAAFGNNVKDLAFKSKAPPALNLPPSMMAPSPPFMREVTNKSATLAERLGISREPEPTAKLSAASIIVLGQLDKGKGKASPPPFTPIRKKMRVRRPSVVLEVRPFDVVGFQGAVKGGIVRSNSRSSISSSVSGASAPNSDNDSDYSHDSSITVIRPLPGVPVPDDSNDSTDSDASSDLSPKRRHGRPTTMSSVWSQESRQTLQPLELETYLAMRELRAKGPRKNGVDAASGRLRAPAGPRRLQSARALKIASKLSTQFTKIVAPTWSPSGTRDLEFKMVLAPNDSAV